MDGKTCFKCNKFKSLDNFYKHPRMLDGHVNKCKVCNKKDVRDNYQKNIDYYHDYDKKRNQTDHRKANQVKNKVSLNRRKPEMVTLRKRVAEAIRVGMIIKTPCVKCGDPKSEGHHADYSKPYDLTWLCFKCHRTEHGQKVSK